MERHEHPSVQDPGIDRPVAHQGTCAVVCHVAHADGGCGMRCQEEVAGLKDLVRETGDWMQEQSGDRIEGVRREPGHGFLTMSPVAPVTNTRSVPNVPTDLLFLGSDL